MYAFIFNIASRVYAFVKAALAPRDYTIEGARLCFSSGDVPLPRAPFARASGDIVHPLGRFSHASIRYFLGGRVFEMITPKFGGYVWPPPKSSGVVFAIPVTSATFGDDDVLDRVLELAGPRGDFHGARVPLAHAFPDRAYASDALVIGNAMGTTVRLNPKTDALEAKMWFTQ